MFESLLGCSLPFARQNSLFYISHYRRTCCALTLPQTHFTGARRIPLASQRSPEVLWIIPAGTWATPDTPSPAAATVFFCQWISDLLCWISDLGGLGLWPRSVAPTKCVLWAIFCSTISAVTPLTSLVSEGTFLVNRGNMNSDQVTRSRFCQQAKNNFVTWR